MNTSDPQKRRERAREKIAQGKKSVVITVMNILLQKYLGDDYRKSFLKKEPYILADNQFKNAVRDARIRLQLDEQSIIPERWKEYLRSGSIISADKEDPNYAPFRAKYNSEVDQVIKEASLTREWNPYVYDYMVDMIPPKKPLFIFPKTIWVTDINEEGEILIRLKPGLRHSDYTKAWKVFARHLGNGNRLEKPYTNKDRDAIYDDKLLGLSYRQLAVKYFPNTEISSSIDRVKKIVSREKQRRAGDK